MPNLQPRVRVYCGVLNTSDVKITTLVALDSLQYAYQSLLEQPTKYGISQRQLHCSLQQIRKEILSDQPKIHNSLRRNTTNKLSGHPTVCHYIKPSLHLKTSCDATLNGLVFYQQIFNKKKLENLKDQEHNLFISISTAGSEARIKKVLVNCINCTPKKLQPIFVIGINETFDNTVRQIDRLSKQYLGIPFIINEVPPLIKKGPTVDLRNYGISTSINLYVLREMMLFKQGYLLIVADDIMIPSKKSISTLIRELQFDKNLRVTGGNVLPFPAKFFSNGKESEKYYHPIFYRNLRRTYLIDQDPCLPARPNVHGAFMLLRLIDHPLYIPSEVTFQDLWISIYFAKNFKPFNKLKSRRSKSSFVYHHEPTSLSAWLSRWGRIQSMLKEDRMLFPPINTSAKIAEAQRVNAITNQLIMNKKSLADFLLLEETKHQFFKTIMD